MKAPNLPLWRLTRARYDRMIDALERNATVSPLAAPRARIRVASLLP